MKKTLFLLVAALMLQFPMAAQDLSKASKSVAKAIENTQNPKKASNPDTWVKLAKEYIKAYDLSCGNGMLHTPREQVQMLVSESMTLAGTSNVEASGNAYLRDSYENVDYYYKDNILMMIVPTKFAVENPLDGALKAYAQAATYDVKAKKTKDILEGIKTIVAKYSEQAFNQYNLGNLALATLNFEAAGDASATAPYTEFDGASMSNAGLLAFQSGDLASAKRCFNKCMDKGFYDEDGKVFAYLSEIAGKEGDTKAQLDYLKKGFEAFPSSQAIIIGLINAYRSAKEDPNEIFVLLGKAKENDPKNASLYSTEGDIHKELKQDEQAIACYRAASAVDPTFAYGWIGEGLLYYDRAIEYATAANESVSDADYRKYLALYEETMPKAVEPFEKAFELATSNPNLRTGVAEYLKNIYYRFQDKGDAYVQGYKKYNDFLKNGQ
ncbi:MAG: hypothetical protein IIX64_03135 [Bacteroidales bacterium]|nr:hypothetical protein [Bacteroidales bacterium]